MLSNQELEELKEIYLYSNTPLFLYENFRKHGAIKMLSQKDTKILIDEFKEIASGIETVDQLVKAYATYLSITFKPYDEVVHFLNGDGHIRFEWFNDVREMYLAKNKPTVKESFNLSNQYIRPSYIRNKPTGVTDSVTEISV